MATETIVELQQTFTSSTPATESSAPVAARTSHEFPAESSPFASVSTTGATVLTRTRAIIAIIQLSGMTLLTSFCNGIIVIGLPTMATELKLEGGLLVWPTSAFYLTAGSCLLMAGSIADVVGTKRVNMIGSFVGAVFAAACGFARTGGELIAFRALQGVTNAITVPSSISIISRSVEEGQPRNIGFACQGFAATIGFSLGLVLGGVFVDGVGWRAAFYIAGAASFVLFLVGLWVLPRDARLVRKQSMWKRLASEIDWMGAIIASVGLATLSYVMATLAADVDNIHHAINIALLIVSIASIPAFAGWMHYQARHRRIALIPNPLWKSSVFTSVCIMVLFTSAVTNCMELYSSLFFQNVQEQSALQASLQILPSLIAGGLTNLSTGVFVSRMPVLWTLLISSGLSAIAPLLMAIIRPEWAYWYDAFFAQILTPLSSDMLFTVGLLVISNVFPAHMQALSAAVFNTCAQLGTAIGLSITSVIASSITNKSPYVDKSSPDALMTGYRAVFWTMFAWMMLVCVVCVLGMRQIKAVGVKRD